MITRYSYLSLHVLKTSNYNSCIIHVVWTYSVVYIGESYWTYDTFTIEKYNKHEQCIMHFDKITVQSSVFSKNRGTSTEWSLYRNISFAGTGLQLPLWRAQSSCRCRNPWKSSRYPERWQMTVSCSAGKTGNCLLMHLYKPAKTLWVNGRI